MQIKLTVVRVIQGILTVLYRRLTMYVLGLHVFSVTCAYGQALVVPGGNKLFQKWMSCF